jgi:hypothetical protein
LKPQQPSTPDVFSSTATATLQGEPGLEMTGEFKERSV